MCYSNFKKIGPVKKAFMCLFVILRILKRIKDNRRRVSHTSSKPKLSSPGNMKSSAATLGTSVATLHSFLARFAAFPSQVRSNRQASFHREGLQLSLSLDTRC